MKSVFPEGSLAFAFHSLLEGEILPSQDCALVLEDDKGVCGYALSLADAKQAAAKIQVPESTRLSRASRRWSSCATSVTSCASFHQRAVNDDVLEDFPTLIAVQVLPRVTDSPAKRMIGQLLSSIKSSGRSRLCASKKFDVLFDETVKFSVFNIRKMSDLNVVIFNCYLLFCCCKVIYANWPLHWKK